MRLAGKKALVTGASRGVGRAIAAAFVAEGIKVFGTSRDPDSVEWPDGVTPIALDAGSSELVQRGWDAANLQGESFDIVVNNAGAGAFGAFDADDFEQWEQQIGLLLGAMKLAHLSLRQWSPERPGVLVNVCSLVVEYPIPYMSGYNAAKAGLAAFSESLLLEQEPRRVRVVELRLGDVNTGFNESVRGRPSDPRQEKVWAAMDRHVAKGPSPERVAWDLLKALQSGKEGVVKTGGFFQTSLASGFGKLVSQGLRRMANLAYYSIERNR